MNLHAINRLHEVIHYLEIGHEGLALQHLDEARELLIPPRVPWPGKPEDDPSRSSEDRAAWRKARG
jgi:hypothetical protein